MSGFSGLWVQDDGAPPAPEGSRGRTDARGGPCALCLQCHCPLCARRSLALGQQYTSLGSQPLLCGSIPGLVPKQLRFCRNYIEIMPSVAEGVKLGIQECQHQFRGRRWNCTTIDDSLAIFGPVLDKGTVSGPGRGLGVGVGEGIKLVRTCSLHKKWVGSLSGQTQAVTMAATPSQVLLGARQP